MIVLAAAGVKSGFAMRAGIVGSHVILDAQLISADSAKDGFLTKFSFGPNLMLVVSFFFMAGKAGIVFVTAFELDGDDIELGMPMHASGLVVHRFAIDIDATDL